MTAALRVRKVVDGRDWVQLVYPAAGARVLCMRTRARPRRAWGIEPTQSCCSGAKVIERVLVKIRSATGP
jgi:hypothetical protein